MAPSIPSYSTEAPPVERFPYRPKVSIDQVDFAFELGAYRFFQCSTGVRSLGLINYTQVLAVLDADDKDVLYVTTESNPMDGQATIYLGRFTPECHATLCSSPTLALPAFFLPVACQVARETLNLSYEFFPLTSAENSAIAAIPQLFAQHYPDGYPDEICREWMINLEKAVVTSNNSRAPGPTERH